VIGRDGEVTVFLSGLCGMMRTDRAYHLSPPLAEDVMRKPLAIIAALLLAAVVLGVLAAAPLSLYYS
jgi:hypothetical protein